MNIIIGNMLLGLVALIIVTMWTLTFVGTNIYILYKEENYITGSQLIAYYLGSIFCTYLFFRVTGLI